MNNPKPFDILDQFAKFGLAHKLSLREPDTASAFVKHAGAEVERALADPALLHGQRAEAMFEALAVSLGDFTLIKREDTGFVFPDEGFAVPDFRVVLNSGEQWLIEVKNVYEENPGEQRRRLMNSDYRRRLEAYSAATGAQLRLAVFWARWGLWTLVSPEKLVNEDGDLVLDMFQAMKANEMAAIGDRSVGTKSPLLLRLIPDPENTSPIGEDGSVQITIGSVEVYCGEKEIVDPVEKEIVWIFMQHGEWEETGPEAEVEGNILKAIQFRWEPQQHSEEGFDMIGSLSRMFSRHYAEATVENREVVQVRAPHRPEWLAPILSIDIQRAKLPLWVFVQQPNFEGC